MRLVDAHARLLGLGQPAFTTADAAACLGVARAHASKLLGRLSDAGLLVHLARSLWAVPAEVEALQLPGILAAPAPAYVSLQSALFQHGMISQIPEVIYAVSVARTRRADTPLGTVSIHHVAPGFFFGYAPTGPKRVLLATPEKALLDVFYLSPGRSGLFRSLPELDLRADFHFDKAREMVAKIRAPRRRRLVADRLDNLK